MSQEKDAGNKKSRRCGYVVQDLIRSCLPFLLLITWLIIGMFMFYFFESPAENDRQKEAQQQGDPPPQSDLADLQAKFNNSAIFEETVVIYLPIGNATFSANNDGNSPTGELIEYFNQKFFTDSKKHSVFGAKMKKLGVSANGQYFTLTIFYSNVAREQTAGEVIAPVENIKWNMPGSFFFCLTVVTTIGYGNYAPSTTIGKCLCVVYSFVGIPLFLLAVDEMRKLLFRLACQLHEWFYRFGRWCGKRSERMKRMFKVSDEKQQERNDELLSDRNKFRTITAMVAVIGCLAFIFVPAIVFVFVEGWDYLSSLYFCFISLSTIGFGDLIAGQKSSGSSQNYKLVYSFYRLVICVWLFFGIAFGAALTQIIQTMLQRLITRIRIGSDKKASGVGGHEEENTVNLLDIIDNDIYNENEKKYKEIAKSEEAINNASEVGASCDKSQEVVVVDDYQSSTVKIHEDDDTTTNEETTAECKV